MFHIKFKLAPSPLHGIGLFADQPVNKGELVYTPNLNLDICLSVAEFEQLSGSEQWPFVHYGYFDKHLNKWHLAHDDIRFCNHATSGNVTMSDDDDLIALRYIEHGEEILQDYREFEELREDLRKIP